MGCPALEDAVGLPSVGCLEPYRANSAGRLPGK